MTLAEQLTIERAQAVIDLSDMLLIEMTEACALLADVASKKPLTAADRLRAAASVRTIIGCLRDIRSAGKRH